MEEKNIYRFFELTVWFKLLQSAAEIAAGGLLYFASTQTLTNIVAFMTGDTPQGADDLLSHYLFGTVQNLSADAKSFAVFFLVSHGLIKIVPLGGLVWGKMWAYPLSLFVLACFVVYQLYRFSHTHSYLLLALTAFDMLVLALIWHEWSRARRHLQTH